MIQTETQKANLLFVNLPIDANNLRFASYGDEAFIEFHSEILNEHPKHCFYLPKGNKWMMLNALNDISEDDAVKVIDARSSEAIKTHAKKLYEIALASGAQGKTIVFYEPK